MGVVMNKKKRSGFYWRVETKQGWSEIGRAIEPTLREAKIIALELREFAKQDTGSRYCLLTKHEMPRELGTAGKEVGRWPLSNAKPSLWTKIYLSAVSQ